MTAPPAVSPLHLVVMGVSGSGKTTIAQAINGRLGWQFAEGDDFHPPTSVAKMAAGLPLTDADRWPWLRALVEWTREHDRQGRSTVLTCSALRRAYRDVLREGTERTFFVHLVGTKALLLDRMSGREHYMPISLLQSQLDTLEPLGADEAGMVVDVAHPPARIADRVLTRLDLG